MTDDYPDSRTPPAENQNGKRLTWRGAYISHVFMLRRRREELGLTQAMVAAKIGMALRSYQRKEAAKEDGPEFQAMQLYQLAWALGVTITMKIDP